MVINLIICRLKEGSVDYTDEAGKVKQNDNPFINEPVHGQTVVDMKGKIQFFFLSYACNSRLRIY